jgi:hypothetical protein
MNAATKTTPNNLLFGKGVVGDHFLPFEIEEVRSRPQMQVDVAVAAVAVLGLCPTNPAKFLNISKSPPPHEMLSA